MALKSLVTIVGTTGVGKSRLAVDLALSMLNNGFEHGLQSAKVINSDAMQAYTGADVITNKMPLQERKGVDHLLIGFKQPGEQYVVGQWVNDAIREIGKLHQHLILPIVVGGTAYWLQHLAFPNRLTSFNDGQPTSLPAQKSTIMATESSVALQNALFSLPQPFQELFMDLPENPVPEQAFSLHSLLSALDPIMAARWHWRDTRKVLRSLEIIKENGCLVSEIMAQQTQEAQIPRYQTLIFWLYSDPSLLQQRLDARVEQMMRDGLLEDVRMLRNIALSKASSSNGGEIDMTSGIFQSIGFKEFNAYLASEFPGENDYEEALERTKISNRQYAKRQVQWIRNKLLPAVNAANELGSNIPVYLLNVQDLDNWDKEVRDPAVKILHDFLSGNELPHPHSLSETAKSLLNAEIVVKDPIATLTARRKIICEFCTVDPQKPMMLNDGEEWKVHIKTRRHRRFRRDKEHPEWRESRRQVHSQRFALDGSDDDMHLALLGDEIES